MADQSFETNLIYGPNRLHQAALVQLPNVSYWQLLAILWCQMGAAISRNGWSDLVGLNCCSFLMRIYGQQTLLSDGLSQTSIRCLACLCIWRTWFPNTPPSATGLALLDLGFEGLSSSGFASFKDLVHHAHVLTDFASRFCEQICKILARVSFKLYVSRCSLLQPKEPRLYMPELS